MPHTFLSARYQKSLIKFSSNFNIVDSSTSVCIASSDNTLVGEKITLPRQALKTSRPLFGKFQKKKTVFVPIKMRDRTIAVFYTDSKNILSANPLKLLESSLELFFRHYWEFDSASYRLNNYLLQLLHEDSSSNLSRYELMAKLLGYAPTATRITLVINFDGFYGNKILSAGLQTEEVIHKWEKRIFLALQSFFTQDNDMMLSYLGNDEFAVVKTTSDPDKFMSVIHNSALSIFSPLNDTPRSKFSVGIGNPHTGVQGILQSFGEAQLALRIGLANHPTRICHFYRELGVERVFGEENRSKQIEFANQILTNITDKNLLKTLEVFFSCNLNLTETAKTLCIHRNTALYRLNQIQELTGKDPRNFEHAMEIRTAMMIKKLLK